MSYALYSPHVAPLGLATPVAVEKRNAALAILQAQPCYTAELDGCLKSSTPTSFPGCATLLAAYADKDSSDYLDGVVAKIPYCAPPTSVATYIAVGAFGLAAGLLIGAML